MHEHTYLRHSEKGDHIADKVAETQRIENLHLHELYQA